MEKQTDIYLIKAISMSKYLLMHLIKEEQPIREYCDRFKRIWNGLGKENPYS
jgi:hypothetical protein